MKLLVQSDDYGITPAVSLGIIEAIRNGIVRNTGLFVNMKWAEECVTYIRPYMDQIGFGIDLNISAGEPVLPAEEIPGLVQENGMFLTSTMNKLLDTDENNHDHVDYDEVYREFEAQIQLFIKIVGKTPDYIHGHAYGTKTTMCAMKELAQKYNSLFSSDILWNQKMKPCNMEWYRFGNEMEAQFQDDIKKSILEDHNEFLKAEYGCVISHCGYIDSKLFDFTSYTIYRIKDLEALTSDEIKDWIKQNHIELITYNNLIDWSES
jgi:predicted glycoside hydrolase/deacetylase ChbG (UPF0249 family)